jgi:DNA-nicking Smr family endonuclease
LDRFFAARFRQDELRTTIDLHGQAVSDAVTLCEEVIELCRALVARKEGALASHYLCIITGAGHHSAGNLPRVRPAVEKLLLARGISYRAANAGSFVARILKTS